MAKTTNNGGQWIAEPLPGDPFSISGLAFITPDVGWAGGHVGIWLRTA